MKFVASSVAVLALASAVAAPASLASSVVLKCSPETPVLFPRAPQTVYVLDGKLVRERDVNRVPVETIESISIVCAEELYQTFGVRARVAGVVIFTAPGPYSALKSAVESIAPLQDAHLAEHGRFAATLEELGWRDPAGLITVTLTLGEDGSRWTATGTHRHLLGSWAPEITASGEAAARADPAE